MRDAREAALAFVAGREVAEIVRYGEEIYDELHGRRRSARAPARSPSSTSTPASGSGWSPRPRSSWPRSSPARLGLTGALGTVAEVDDGRYTGRLVGDPLHGPAKAAAVRALAEREGLDLSRCSGLLRLRQRRADAVAGRPRRRRQPRPRPRGRRQGTRLARPGLPHRPQGRQDRRTDRRRRSARVAGGVAAGLALRKRYAGLGSASADGS